MPFTLPTFNLTANLFTFGGPYVVPRATTLCNLSPGRRVMLDDWRLSMFLLCPALTDIRWSVLTSDGDYVEVPAGSGRWYFVRSLDDVAKGFANEYRVASLQPSANQHTGGGWPVPMP